MTQATPLSSYAGTVLSSGLRHAHVVAYVLGLAVLVCSPRAQAQLADGDDEAVGTYAYLGLQGGGARGTETERDRDVQRKSDYAGAFVGRGALTSDSSPVFWGAIGGFVLGMGSGASINVEMHLGLQVGYAIPDIGANVGLRMFAWWNGVPLRQTPDNADEALAFGAFFNMRRLGVDFSFAPPGTWEAILLANNWTFLSLEARYAITEADDNLDPGFFVGGRFDHSWRSDEKDYSVSHYYLLAGVGW